MTNKKHVNSMKIAYEDNINPLITLSITGSFLLVITGIATLLLLGSKGLLAPLLQLLITWGLVGFGITLLPISSITMLNLYLRHQADDIPNLWKSVTGTLALRWFLIRQEVATTQGINATTHTTVNLPILRYNKAVRHSYINIMGNHIVVNIAIPKTIQSRQLLEESKEVIYRYISGQYPNFAFSAPIEKNNSLIIEGTLKTR